MKLHQIILFICVCVEWVSLSGLPNNSRLIFLARRCSLAILANIEQFGQIEIHTPDNPSITIICFVVYNAFISNQIFFVVVLINITLVLNVYNEYSMSAGEL